MAVDEKQLTEDILRLAATDVRRCMQCGRCSANCEAASKMDLLPHRVVWDLNSVMHPSCWRLMHRGNVCPAWRARSAAHVA